MALADDYEVEGLYGDSRVVDDGKGLPDEMRVGLEHRVLLSLLLVVLLALGDGVEALDRGDHHPTRRVYGVGTEVLDVVLVGEGPVGVGAYVLAELVEGLGTQVLAIHQEEHPFCPGELDEPVDGGHGGKSLPLPIVICTSERGRFSAREHSRLLMASIWAGQRPSSMRGGISRSLSRTCSSRVTSRRRSSGRWKAKTTRLRASVRGRW